MMPSRILFKVILLVVFGCLLIVNSIQGYSYGWQSIPSRVSILRKSEVNKVLKDPIERERLRLLIDQVYTERPPQVPECLYTDQIYDPITNNCSKPNTQGHCNNRMVFLPVPNTEDTIGACACENSGCWGQPQVLFDNNQCYSVATQGPCADGETVVPISKFRVKCSKDACLHATPQWAINFSHGSKEQPEKYPVFRFTYKGSCFLTESEAFCAKDHVVRFVVPYKIPVCVHRHKVGCAGAFVTGYAFQATAYRDCEPGTAANPTTGICKRILEFDFK